MVPIGKCRFDLVLEPVSGKAVPVHRGEVMRITQVEGEQCVDLNAFNLHDYKEHLCTGATEERGLRPKEGDFVWSQPPRYRPIINILSMPPSCATELHGARCNAAMFEMSHGFEIHSNCQDTLAESIGEYGLTPDDVHNTFCLWMNSQWDDKSWWLLPNTGKKGDYVDLLALIDLLMVTAICGSGDVGPISNFSLKPIRIQVFEKSNETEDLVAVYEKRYFGLKNQRTPTDFRVRDIKATRELVRDSTYKPNFPNYPLVKRQIEVDLSSDEYVKLQSLRQELRRTSDGDALMSAFLVWWIRNKSKGAIPPVWRAYSTPGSLARLFEQ